MIDCENIKAELQILSGTYLGFGGQVRTAAAGEQLITQLINPVDSGSILTMTKVSVGLTANDTIIMSNVGGITTFDVSVTGRRLDNRAGDDAVTQATIGTFSQVGALGGVAFFRHNANSPLILEDPNGLAVIGPGTSFKVGSTAAAIFQAVSFFWRERVLLESEQNLIG